MEFRDGLDTTPPTASLFALATLSDRRRRQYRLETSSSLPEPSSNCRLRFPERHSEAHWAGTASDESELRVPFGLPGDQDDGHCRELCLHSLGKRHPVAVRHVDVADDQSNLVSKFLDDPKTVGTVSSLDGLEVFPLQNGADELPNGRLVINDKRDVSHASLDGQSVRDGSAGLPIWSLLKGAIPANRASKGVKTGIRLE